MPQKRSAYKEIRKSKRRRQGNVKIVSELKTLVKKFNALLSDKKIDEARTYLKSVFSKFDKAAKKGVIPKNTASRKLSRLSKRLRKLAGAK